VDIFSWIRGLFGVANNFENTTHKSVSLIIKIIFSIFAVVIYIFQPQFLFWILSSSATICLVIVIVKHIAHKQDSINYIQTNFVFFGDFGRAINMLIHIAFSIGSMFVLYNGMIQYLDKYSVFLEDLGIFYNPIAFLAQVSISLNSWESFMNL